VPWEYFVHIEDAIRHYADQGCTVIALEKNEKSKNIFDIKKPESVALIVGNELE